MGVYSNDRTGLSGSVNVDPDTRYYGESALGLMMVEAQQNDMALFDAVIRNDINESFSIREGTILESELESLQEGVIGNIGKRIVEMLKNMLAKVKHIFEVFIAKITSLTTNDGKKFIKMNEKRINYAELDKIKCKFRKLKVNGLVQASSSVEEFEKGMSPTTYKDMTAEVIDKEIEDLNDADSGPVAMILQKATGDNNTTSSSFSKDLMDSCFEDEDEVSVKSILSEIKLTITTGGKTLEENKKLKEKTISALNKSIKEFDRLEKANNKDGVAKASDNKTSKTSDKSFLQARAYNLAAKHCGYYQTAINTVIGGMMNITRFNIAQSRRCFVRACTSAKKEDAMLNTMIEESAEFDFMQSFEDFSVPEMA